VTTSAMGTVFSGFAGRRADLRLYRVYGLRALCPLFFHCLHRTSRNAKISRRSWPPDGTPCYHIEAIYRTSHSQLNELSASLRHEGGCVISRLNLRNGEFNKRLKRRFWLGGRRTKRTKTRGTLPKGVSITYDTYRQREGSKPK